MHWLIRIMMNDWWIKFKVYLKYNNIYIQNVKIYILSLELKYCKKFLNASKNMKLIINIMLDHRKIIILNYVETFRTIVGLPIHSKLYPTDNIIFNVSLFSSNITCNYFTNRTLYEAKWDRVFLHTWLPSLSETFRKV